MTKYVAMVRGIGPENPNMRGKKLQLAFESIGLSNVRSFLTSGNVLFESDIQDTNQLEVMAEEALPRLLDFSRSVFIRSQENLEAIVDADPFEGLTHQNGGKTYLTVTFFKRVPTNLPTLPYHPDGRPFELHHLTNGGLCSIVDLTTGRTPDLMTYLEHHYGKELTTRTYATICRVVKKLTA